jgi:thiosulfate/3-mercaptopyruvate sulfurtransferase
MTRKMRLGLIVLATLAVGLTASSFHWVATAAESQTAGADQVFAAATLLEPNQVAEMLSNAKDKPPILQVGFDFLYNSAHIPGALYLGPGRTAAGREALAKWAENVPRNKTLLIYCGCCPWDKCPNIRPAYLTLHEMGFTQVRVIHIGQDFAKDWVDKGFPIEKK